jgi:hypothetical protein
MIVKNLELRRGDLKPDLVVDLEDDGALIPVTTAASMSVIGARNGVMLFKRAVPTDTDGIARMEWQAGDTATAGTITVEVEIVWPGTKPQSIRTGNTVKVLPDLG